MVNRTSVRLGILTACLWLGACFSGGKVVDQQQDVGSSLTEDGGVADGGANGTGTTADAADTSPADTAPACADGTKMCGGQCVDTSTVDNCGDCGVSCQAAGDHTVAACRSGACAQDCEAGWVDADGDSSNGCELECTPSNNGIEICDGVDNDCNGVVDDGFDTGPCTVGTGACEATGNYVCSDDGSSSSCDATAGTPSDEVCGDGVDNDCDGQVDEDDAVDAQTWYADSDGDGFGDPSTGVHQCDAPAGDVTDNTDCDDSDASVHLQMQGYADQDGDGFTTGGVQTLCTDGSLPAGYVDTQHAGDCDDSDDAVNPAADEVCGDSIDNDCDGQVDDPSAVDAKTWYVDCDGDGYAADVGGSRTACTKPAAPSGCSSSSANWTETRPGGTNTDCNDAVADAHPGQTNYFTRPMSATNFNAKWDYDCDGVATQQYTGTDGYCHNCDLGTRQPGWVDSFAPSCGQSADFQDCGYQMFQGRLQCDDSLQTGKKQPCR